MSVLLQKLSLVVTIIGLLVSGVGCGPSRSEVDSLIEEVWLDINQGELQNVVEYLKGGGLHFDVGGQTTVDQDYVIPLCERIQNELGAECFAIFFDDSVQRDFTSEILIKMNSRTDKSGIRKALAATEQAFGGHINTLWGNKWLSISFTEKPLED